MSLTKNQVFEKSDVIVYSFQIALPKKGRIWQRSPSHNYQRASHRYENTWLETVSPQVRFVWGGWWPKGWIEPQRYIYDHELVIITDGALCVEVGQGSWVCEEPSFIIVPSGVPHQSRALAKTHRECIHFDWAPSNKKAAPLCTYLPDTFQKELKRPAPGMVPRGIHHGPIADVGRVKALARSLSSRWCQLADAERLSCRALLLEILTLLLSSHGTEVKIHNSAVQAAQVKDLLERNLLTQASIAEILKPLGLSSAHLGRIFKQAYGLSLIHYLLTIRLERAKQLLGEPQLHVAEVVRASGFADTAYFGRAFRRRLGLSPRAYRHSVLGGG